MAPLAPLAPPAPRILRWHVWRLLTALFLCLAAVTGAVSTPFAEAATTSNVAYVFDFGSGVNDTGGPGSGSGIFVNAITGGAIGAGNTGTYNGVSFTNVPVSAIDASPGTALNGFDTVLLYEVCDISSHPATITAVNAFLTTGHKVMIFDADRCAASVAGQANYSAYLFPFATNSPGPQGASGSYTAVEASTLTTGLAVGAQPGDAVGDSNTFTSHAGSWCAAITATNVNSNTGFVEAYARTAAGGLSIYEGEDFWFTFGPTSHLKQVFDDMLAQAFNPDGLPCTIPASGIKLDPATATNPLGATHTVTATVVNSSGTAAAGVTVTFTVQSGPDAGVTGTGVTDGSGHATFSYANNSAPGTDTIVAKFTDGTGTVESSNQVTKTWVRASTTLTYTGATTSDFNDPATLSATLISAVTNAPIAGATINFTLDGQSCAGVTNVSGQASCGITPNEAANSYPLTATFAGNANFLPSSFSGTFVVTKEETTLAITSSNTLPLGGVVVSAVLKEDGATPISGRTVTFTAGALTANGTTNGSGVATVTLALAPGAYTLNASFAGDPFYKPSTAAAQTLFVFQPTNFVIWGGNPGAPSPNITIGADYQFWGAKWADQVLGGNYLANQSFKGFAENLVGSTWNTDTGNNADEPATVASYIGVIVTTQVAMNGSVVSGNVAEIVVLKVDDPSAYQPNPGHPASGVAVAIVH